MVFNVLIFIRFINKKHILSMLPLYLSQTKFFVRSKVGRLNKMKLLNTNYIVINGKNRPWCSKTPKLYMLQNFDLKYADWSFILRFLMKWQPAGSAFSPNDKYLKSANLKLGNS